MDFLSDFGVQPILLAAQVVNFLVLLFILKKVLYKPMLKILAERKQKIAESLKNAEEIKLKLQKTEEDREKKLADATKEGTKLIDEATKSASLIIEEAHTKASKDIEKIIEEAKSQIENDREMMRQEIKEELADLVGLTFEKVVGKILTEKDRKSLVERSIKNLN